MNTYVKQYVRNCILNRKVIPSIKGIEDRITFIKLMIDLVNKKIEQENN